MNSRKSVAVGLVLLTIGLGLTAFCVAALYHWFRGLDSNVAAAISAAAISLFGLLYAQWHSKTREIAESHRASKIEVYSIFFDLVEKFQKGSDDLEDLKDGVAPDWIKEDFLKLNRGLVLWASPGVIRAWLNFRKASESGKDVLQAVDAVYKAIREDLGNSNFGLRRGDLIRIGLSNPDEL